MSLPFDTFTLAAVAHDLRRLFADSRVQRVLQPTAHDLILSLYGSTGAHRLLLSADPNRFRVHLTQGKRPNPVTPPGFCLVCRKDLEGAWLTGIDLPRFDRVLRLTFRAPEGGAIFLFAELMGRNSNLILVSGTGMIRGVIRSSPDGTRSLRVGRQYHDPPGYHDRRDLFAVQPDEPRPDGELTEVFAGISKFAAQEIKARSDNSSQSDWDALKILVERTQTGDFAPHSISDLEGVTQGVWAFEPLSVPPGLRHERDDISVALDTFYANLSAHESESGEKNLLAKAIVREIAFRKKELQNARATLREAERADEYEQQGNLLLANLNRIERGSPSITVVNYYDPEAGEITIALDTKRSPYENAERYFERVRKARDAADYADGQIADLEDELERLADLQKDLETADDATALQTIHTELAEIVGEARIGMAKSGISKPRVKVAEKVYGGNRIGTYTLDGWTLLVGETALANDHLLTRVAAPTDIWMHIRAGTGAHGVLRTNGHPERLPDTVVRRAAAIVAFRSGSAKHSNLVAVDVTERRYVRKPRGAKPGLATYSKARTLDVTPSL